MSGPFLSVAPLSQRRLVGRDVELAALDKLLDAGAPAVASVQACAGMGKTALLRALHDRARARYWTTVPIDVREELSVYDHTTPDDAWAWLKEALALPLGEPSADLLTHVRLGPGTRPPSDLADWRAAILGHTPMLVRIDGYRPTPDFSRWFAGVVAELRAEPLPVVICIAVEPADQERLAPLEPDLELTLGPLSTDAVREHLQGAVAGPPLPEPELDAYACALSESPEMVRGLTRLLALHSRPADRARPTDKTA